MENKSVSRKNTVRLVGYLKENLLEMVENSRGENVIRGSIIVATNDHDSHKVQFYVPEKTKNGEDSAEFEAMKSLLPENTISIAQYLKSTPTANYATASNMSSKIWVMARFEEYATKSGERETSMITLKGFKAGYKTATESSPFTPSASFSCDVYLNKIENETDEEGKDTGRLLIEGYCSQYDGSVFKIDFVAPEEDNIASYIKGHYKEKDTVTLNGDLVSLSYLEKPENTDKQQFFGRAIEERSVIKFIRERVIRGGSKDPIHDGEEGSITTEQIKDGLVIREEKIKKSGGTKKEAPKQEKKPIEPTDFDF